MIQKVHILRRELHPYLIFPVAFGFISIGLILISLKTHQWMEIFYTILVFCVLCVLILIFQLSYKVWFNDNKIVMRVVGGALIIIKIDEIEKIEQETSDIQTFISRSRPFRRIAIYAGNTEKDSVRWIDISLKHFKHEDIRALMKIIHEQRPDLVIPKGWI